MSSKPNFFDVNANAWMDFLVMIVFTLVVFHPVVRFEFLQWDDYLYVTDNVTVLAGISWEGFVYAFTSLESGFWQPLTWLSLMLDASLYGDKPGGYHVTNLIFHLAAGVLLRQFLLAATQRRWLSLFVSLLFLVHPLHVESVAWISERKDVLSALFMMLTLLAYHRYVARRGRQNYIWVVIWHVAALASKSSVVALPLILLLLDIGPYQRLGFAQGLEGGKAAFGAVVRLIGEKVPLLFFSLVFGLLTIFAQGSSGNIRSVDEADILERIGLFFYALKAYITQTFVPIDLVFFYPIPSPMPILSVVVGCILFSVLTAVSIRNWRSHPWLLVGWGWFMLLIAPVSGLVTISSQAHADRFTYLPHIGLFILLSYAVSVWGTNRYPRLWVAAGAVFVLLLAGVAHQQVYVWKNSETLFSHGIEKFPTNYYGYVKLAAYLENVPGRAEDALKYAQIAYQSKPNDYDNLITLGNLNRSVGNQVEALKYYREAVASDPTKALAHYNIGVIHHHNGDLEAARSNYLAALERDESYAEVHDNLALIYRAQSRWDLAEKHHLRAIEINPALAGAHYNLAVLLLRQNRRQEALYYAREAVRVDPNLQPARRMLSNLLQQSGAPR